MSVGLLILCLAIVALVAFSVSATTALGLWALRRRIHPLSAAAQARIYFVASLLPAFASAVVLVAALAPSFGWIADHCAAGIDPHSHPHVCGDHPVVTWPAMSLIAIACFVAARVLTAVARRLFALALSWVKTHSLLRVSRDGDSGGVRILPVESDAHAFVLGLIRPILFVTEGLATGAEKQHLGAVIAHERAHIRRRDPLRRFIAGIGLALHLPGVARWIEMQLSRTQEIAADREAARAVGAARVARALVALAKSKLRVPRTAIAFAATSIEDRVRLVMDARTRSDWPSLATVIAAAAVLVVMVVAGADGVHHGVEMMLGAFGD